jgi:predicted O-linked N-acetylglucosamine transferase (SPINDLY family)
VNKDRLLRRGRELHEAGDLRGAADHYQKVLSADPRDAGALYRLGCLMHEEGDSEQSLELLREALGVTPKDCELRNAIGTVLFDLGRDEEAERSLRRAIQIESRPHFHIGLGNLLRRQERFPEALTEFETGLRRGADPGEVHLAMGLTESAAGHFEEGSLHLRQALEFNSTDAAALAALRRLTSDEEADRYLEIALEAVGRDAERLRKFGNYLHDAGDCNGAARTYRKSLLFEDRSPACWFALGCAETSREEYVPAIQCFQKALELRPQWFQARHNLGRALYETGQVDAAIEQLRACATATVNPDVASLAKATIATIVPGADSADNQAILDARQDWARDLSRPAEAESPRIGESQPLRIGYISSFFHRDNWMKPVWGLINRHDRSRFEVHLFSDSPSAGAMYDAHPTDRFHDISSLGNESVRALIQSSGIQVLVDLNGYSELKRLPLFSGTCAPVTIGWFNMYATTGLAGFDYLVGDADVAPPEEDGLYTERIERVSHSYLTFDVSHPAPDVAPPPCLRNQGIAFGCLCSQYKLTPQVIEAFSRILNASPSSTLLLKNRHLQSEAMAGYVLDQFARHGVSSERLALEGPCGHFRFLETYGRIDIALDTFPYNGGTTTTEAIWQGVPVLTFAGDRWASRTSASILRAAGLGEFVAAGLEEFVEMGARLGSGSPEQREALAVLRRDMRDRLRGSAVCDTQAFAREMEEIYLRCWRGSHHAA